MWDRHTAEPPAVPQDGAGSEPHVAAEPSSNATPTTGSQSGRTPQLPTQCRPQRMVSTCDHLHQQQVATDSAGPVCKTTTTIFWVFFFGLFLNEIIHFLYLGWSSFSVYPQQSQSQYSIQPNGGIYNSSSNMNLGVSMSSSGGNMNPMSGQMSSMNEQVTKAPLRFSSDNSSSSLFVSSGLVILLVYDLAGTGEWQQPHPGAACRNWHVDTRQWCQFCE